LRISQLLLARVNLPVVSEPSSAKRSNAVHRETGAGLSLIETLGPVVAQVGTGEPDAVMTLFQSHCPPRRVGFRKIDVST
jgi:hypothetical protein